MLHQYSLVGRSFICLPVLILWAAARYMPEVQKQGYSDTLKGLMSSKKQFKKDRLVIMQSKQMRMALGWGYCGEFS